MLSRASASSYRALSKLVPVVLALAFVACDFEGTPYENPSARRAREWAEDCHDQSSLVATTAGSPNGFECPNRNHKMRVELKTMAGEEIAALVVCECEREDGE